MITIFMYMMHKLTISSINVWAALHSLCLLIGLKILPTLEPFLELMNYSFSREMMESKMEVEPLTLRAPLGHPVLLSMAGSLREYSQVALMVHILTQ